MAGGMGGARRPPPRRASGPRPFSTELYQAFRLCARVIEPPYRKELAVLPPLPGAVGWDPGPARGGGAR